MKKILFTGLITILSISAVNAQTEQGGMILGANIANLSIGIDDNYSSISLTPNAGYFIIDNLAIGASLPIGMSSSSNGSSSSSYSSFGLGVFGRYYVPMDKISPFVGAGFGFNSSRSKYSYTINGIKFTDSNGPSNNSYANVNAGIAYFLNKNIGVHGTLNVGDLLNPGTTLSLGLGLNIYFMPGGSGSVEE